MIGTRSKIDVLTLFKGLKKSGLFTGSEDPFVISEETG